MADIQLRPGEKFRLGRTSYEVLADADIEAALIEANGAKQDIRQVLFVCPKGCICEATKKVWKCRYSRKQHNCNPGKCPICDATLVEGQPEAKPQPDSVPPPVPNPNACENAAPDAPPQDGQPQQGGAPEGQSKADGTQNDLDDLKQALQQVKDEAKGKAPKGKKSKSPKSPKSPKGDNQPKGNKQKKSPAEQKMEDGTFQQQVQDFIAKLETEDELNDALPGTLDPPPPPPQPKPGLHHCFNCERPTSNPVGKGNLYLCDLCEDMRDHFIECLG